MAASLDTLDIRLDGIPASGSEVDRKPGHLGVAHQIDRLLTAQSGLVDTGFLRGDHLCELPVAALPAAMTAALPSPVSAFAISSALIQTPSSFSFASADDSRDPLGPPRMMQDGCRLLLPHGSRNTGFLVFGPILGLVLEVLRQDRQAQTAALGNCFPADLHQGFLVLDVLLQKHRRSPMP
ncbi:MAG: hypothetical protein KJ947_08130 [Alphaproteobacteria bacterium]|nr:hypothetical protein [Alphaproteobacteria bacterium]MBU2336379.1 hypothetical protein [Alphaproteobacteria bacterium]